MSVSGVGGGTKTIRIKGMAATKYRIVDADNTSSVVIGPVTTGITSIDTLYYKATTSLPNTAGDYIIQWDDGSGLWAGTEDLTVTNTVSTGIPGQLKPPY